MVNKIILNFPFVCLSVFAASPCVSGEESGWSGEAGFSASYSRTDHVSKSITLDGDFQYRAPTYRMIGEWTAWRESVLLPDAPEAESAKHDLIFKYIRQFPDSDNYYYLSPRFRGNFRDYYVRSSAIRIGVGQEIAYGSNFVVSLEGGIGYREVLIADNAIINENLRTVSAKSKWMVGQGVVIKFSASLEESDQEKYQTLEFIVKKNIINNLGLRYLISYRRTFSLDPVDRTGELRTTLGINYDF